MSLSAARGIAKVARFDAAGLAAFDATPRGLLNALTPWLAFAIVASVLMAVGGEPVAAVSDLLASVVGLLMPPVMSHALARFWQRQGPWLRYAVAVAWCQWLMPPALLGAVMLNAALVDLGVAGKAAETAAMLALLAYALALNIFLARHGLELGRWRAVLLVVAVNIATGAAVLLPTMVEFALENGV